MSTYDCSTEEHYPFHPMVLAALFRVLATMWSVVRRAVSPIATDPPHDDAVTLGRVEASLRYTPCLTCLPELCDVGPPRIERPLPSYQEFYKVVYIADTNDILERAGSSPHQWLPVQSTVAVLTLRTRMGVTSIFNDAGRRTPSSDLVDHAQYALDEALVVTARFMDLDARKAQECARQYQTGRRCLVPQMCVHNQDLAMMTYEVGCVVRVPDAGQPGLNQCVRGVHVHINEQDALEHARAMGLQLDESSGSTVLALEVVPVYDGPLGELKWFRWNCRPTPWNDNKDTRCLSCMRLMNASGLKYAVMDCGHGYLCSQCVSAARELMICPQCSINASRISAYSDRFWDVYSR